MCGKSHKDEFGFVRDMPIKIGFVRYSPTMVVREKMRDFVPLAGYKINMFVPFQILTAIFVPDHVKFDGFVPFYV